MPTQPIPFKTRFRAVKQLLRFLGGGLALLGTWFYIWLLIAAMTEMLLVPWDVLGSPPEGTVSETINNFFESDPGDYLPSWLFLLTSIYIFLFRFDRSRKKANLLLFFAFSNFLFIGCNFVLLFVWNKIPDLWLPQPRPEIDVGFHRTWPSIAIIIVLVTVLFAIQLRGDGSWKSLRLRK